MSPLKLAKIYMDIVFGNGDIEELLMILSDNFTFEGPLYKFDTPQGYVQSLQLDPPKDFKYKIIKAFEDESSACLIYQFSKQNLNLPMAQLFEIEGNKIKQITLIFDASAFKSVGKN